MNARRPYRTMADAAINELAAEIKKLAVKIEGKEQEVEALEASLVGARGKEEARLEKKIAFARAVLVELHKEKGELHKEKGKLLDMEVTLLKQQGALKPRAVLKPRTLLLKP